MRLLCHLHIAALICIIFVYVYKQVSSCAKLLDNANYVLMMQSGNRPK